MLKPINTTLENRFKAGDSVYALENPTCKLIVRRYVERIYYCQLSDNLSANDQAFFDRELTDKVPNSL